MYLFFLLPDILNKLTLQKLNLKKIKKIYLNIINNKSKCSKCLQIACKHLLNLYLSYENQLVKNNFF